MIKFEHVSKVYTDGFKAVDSVSFEVPEGEFLVLIGPSGSGKSTTMKMINRMIPHTNGTISIDGKDITKLNPSELRRNIGYVIQQIGLFPHYTIEKNIAIVPELKGWDKEKIKARVKELLIMVDLDPEVYGSRYPKELSGGQQQRVGVARALASDPRVLLMDEPFGALDPITRDQLQDQLITLQRKLKKTIVFVTHDMDEALKLGDRIAIMKDGNLLQIDTPEKILQEPASNFVEEFIGKDRIIQNPELMPVVSVMTTRVVTSLLNLSPEKALLMMRQQKITSLIIEDDLDDSFVGLISAYELIKKMNSIQSIEEILIVPEHTLTITATARDAIMMMPSVKYGVIPVLNEAKKVVGIVTRGTLLTALSSQWTELEGINE
ncbi:betaine/proline/choline family ABC transporter ATP-binding protein [Psychrobacillus sp. FSL K6-1464]|uniref:betaine/proline/choline family ABC transporter ATP-binding protein n=1 Tax=Psychrobacillus sp. FSL K6-1464 TaxID=2921545 RepID=UPI0030F9553D